MKTRYTVVEIRSGQSKPYGDHEYECLIKVESADFDQAYEPMLLFGKFTDELALASQRTWAKRIVRTLFHEFREFGDKDGKHEGSTDAYFAATLQWLKLDAAKGEIRALIVEPFTD